MDLNGYLHDEEGLRTDTREPALEAPGAKNIPFDKRRFRAYSPMAFVKVSFFLRPFLTRRN
jgi:hypothetical protein